MKLVQVYGLELSARPSRTCPGRPGMACTPSIFYPVMRTGAKFWAPGRGPDKSLLRTRFLPPGRGSHLPTPRAVRPGAEVFL